VASLVKCMWTVLCSDCSSSSSCSRVGLTNTPGSGQSWLSCDAVCGTHQRRQQRRLYLHFATTALPGMGYSKVPNNIKHQLPASCRCRMHRQQASKHACLRSASSLWVLSCTSYSFSSAG
jgi:hypothetical protein